ncbi:MAG: hypothetical protein WKG00_38210 [Polyangiaceae bacterium]
MKEDPMQLTMIDPDTLARDAVEAVLLQLERSATHLFPPGRAAQLRAVSEEERRTRRWREQALSSELGRAVASLVRFAQTGDGQASAPALETPIFEAAFRSAITDDAYAFDDEHLTRALRPQGDLAAVLVNVVLAARTRIHLERSEAVSVPGLAALLGVDMREVRRALRLGATQGWVPADVASAWLATRPDLP